jgi:hypothetical protein
LFSIGSVEVDDGIVEEVEEEGEEGLFVEDVRPDTAA